MGYDYDLRISADDWRCACTARLNSWQTRLVMPFLPTGAAAGFGMGCHSGNNKYAVVVYEGMLMLLVCLMSR